DDVLQREDGGQAGGAAVGHDDVRARRAEADLSRREVVATAAGLVGPAARLADVLHLRLLGVLNDGHGLGVSWVRTPIRVLYLHARVPALLERLRLRLEELGGLLADRALTFVDGRVRAELARRERTVVERFRLVDRGFVDAAEAGGDVGAAADRVG